MFVNGNVICKQRKGVIEPGDPFVFHRDHLRIQWGRDKRHLGRRANICHRVGMGM